VFFYEQSGTLIHQNHNLKFYPHSDKKKKKGNLPVSLVVWPQDSSRFSVLDPPYLRHGIHFQPFIA
jgi:hypothetical protein